MRLHVAKSIWLNDTDVCSIEQLADASGLSIDEVIDLIECGIIAPVDKGVEPQEFQLHYIVTAKTARRLRDDFERDRYGVALALTLLRRIDELEAELQASHGMLRRAL